MEQGKKSEEVAQELRKDPWYYPYPAGSLRKFYAQWKKGLLPEIKLDATAPATPTNTVLQEGTPQDAASHRAAPPVSEKHLQSPSLDDRQPQTVSCTDKELLGRIRTMLQEIHVAERVGLTAPGRKSEIKTTAVACRFPDQLVKELKALPGPMSRHIERACMLYLRALKEGSDNE
jgi:hypothetical protein